MCGCMIKASTDVKKRNYAKTFWGVTLNGSVGHFNEKLPSQCTAVLNLQHQRSHTAADCLEGTGTKGR